MKRRSMRSVLSGNIHGAVTGLIAVFCCTMFASAGELQQPPTQQIKFTVLAQAKSPAWDNHADNVVVVVPHEETPGDRWTKFESEFGIQQQSPWWVGRMLQSAKYRIDSVLFGAQEGVRRCEFTYDVGEASPNDPKTEPAKPQYALPLLGNFGHAQIKTVITQHDPQTGTPFVGVKFTVPFGRKG